MEVLYLSTPNSFMTTTTTVLGLMMFSRARARAKVVERYLMLGNKTCLLLLLGRLGGYDLSL
jgi:hypothetical protein